MKKLYVLFAMMLAATMLFACGQKETPNPVPEKTESIAEAIPEEPAQEVTVQEEAAPEETEAPGNREALMADFYMDAADTFARIYDIDSGFADEETMINDAVMTVKALVNTYGRVWNSEDVFEALSDWVEVMSENEEGVRDHFNRNWTVVNIQIMATEFDLSRSDEYNVFYEGVLNWYGD